MIIFPRIIKFRYMSESNMFLLLLASVMISSSCANQVHSNEDISLKVAVWHPANSDGESLDFVYELKNSLLNEPCVFLVPEEITSPFLRLKVNDNDGSPELIDDGGIVYSVPESIYVELKKRIDPKTNLIQARILVLKVDKKCSILAVAIEGGPFFKVS